jgi:hypothetical protein
VEHNRLKVLTLSSQVLPPLEVAVVAFTLRHYPTQAVQVVAVEEMTQFQHALVQLVRLIKVLLEVMQQVRMVLLIVVVVEVVLLLSELMR